MSLSQNKGDVKHYVCRASNVHFVVFISLVTVAVLYFHSRFFSNDGVPHVSSRPPPVSGLGTRAAWSFGTGAPDFCERIVRHPLPLRMCKGGKCSQDQRNDGRMFSTYRQDYYFFMNHFRNLRRRGIFIDIAANHPVHGSNTFFLEQCLGWDGLCVEANPMYHQLLKEQRHCRLLPTCVGEVEGETVSFAFLDHLGGIVETNKNFGNSNVQLSENKSEVHQLTCRTMRTVFDDYRVSVVDFLSLDVEGHELPVLRGMDFNLVRFNVISVEVSGRTMRPVREFLTSKGYIQHHAKPGDGTNRGTGRLVADYVFLHPSVEWGKPE